MYLQAAPKPMYLSIGFTSISSPSQYANMLTLFPGNSDIEITHPPDPSGFQFTPNLGTHLGVKFTYLKWMGMVSLELQPSVGSAIKSFGLGVLAMK